MKHVATLFVWCIALVSAAQNCTVTDCGFIPNINAEWKSIAVRPDGGFVGALAQGEDVVGDVIAARLDPQGQVIWTKRLATTNPMIHLDAEKVVSTSDGGMLVFGFGRVHVDVTFTAYYTNYFNVKLTTNGEIAWARYYMMSNAINFDWLETSTVEAVPTGGFLMLLSRSNGMCAVRLDDSGLPLWHKRYSGVMSNGVRKQAASALFVEGDGSFCLAGKMEYDPFVVRTDPTGEVIWAHTYSYTVAHPLSISRKIGGGYLLGGNNGFGYLTDGGFSMSLAADGTLEWWKGYDTDGTSGSSAFELQNGELFLASRLAGPNIWMAADGTPLLKWESTVPLTGKNVVAFKNDTVLIALTEGNGFGMQPKLLIAPEPSDLDCQYTSTSTTGNSYTPLVTVTDTIAVAIDSLKTWTMSLGEATELDLLDLDVMLSSGPARPGFNLWQSGSIVNEGGLTSGAMEVTMTFDPALTYVSAAPTPTSVLGNTLIWSGPGLLGFGGLGINVQLNVPVGLALGTPISSTMSVTQDSTEVSLANNTATLNQVIVGSYDPNDKIVSPADFYHIENDSVLFYTIRFQNTGTDTAFTVVVRDTLPLDLSASTFEAGPSSHAYTYSLTGNGILTFTFANILLPDSNTNEPASHGMVSFRIKPNAPLSIGQVISNAADIYFDFNTPIHTADATVVITDDTGMRPVVRREHLKVFPVPVKNILNAVPPAGFKATSAWATGVDGRRFGMALPPVREGQLQFSTQHLGAGSFVLTLQGQDGRLVSARFTKE